MILVLAPIQYLVWINVGLLQAAAVARTLQRCSRKEVSPTPAALSPSLLSSAPTNEAHPFWNSPTEQTPNNAILHSKKDGGKL